MKTKTLEFCMTSGRYPDEARTSGVHMGVAPKSNYPTFNRSHIICTVCEKVLKLRADRIPSHGVYLSTIPTESGSYKEIHPGMDNEALKSYEISEGMAWQKGTNHPPEPRVWA